MKSRICTRHVTIALLALAAAVFIGGCATEPASGASNIGAAVSVASENDATQPSEELRTMAEEAVIESAINDGAINPVPTVTCFKLGTLGCCSNPNGRTCCCTTDGQCICG